MTGGYTGARAAMMDPSIGGVKNKHIVVHGYSMHATVFTLSFIIHNIVHSDRVIHGLVCLPFPRHALRPLLSLCLFTSRISRWFVPHLSFDRSYGRLMTLYLI